MDILQGSTCELAVEFARLSGSYPASLMVYRRVQVLFGPNPQAFPVSLGFFSGFLPIKNLLHTPSSHRSSIALRIALTSCSAPPCFPSGHLSPLSLSSLDPSPQLRSFLTSSSPSPLQTGMMLSLPLPLLLSNPPLRLLLLSKPPRRLLLLSFPKRRIRPTLPRLDTDTPSRCRL